MKLISLMGIRSAVLCIILISSSCGTVSPDPPRGGERQDASAGEVSSESGDNADPVEWDTNTTDGFSPDGGVDSGHADSEAASDTDSGLVDTIVIDDPELPWPTDYATAFADMVLKRWDNALPFGEWSYTTGIVLRGIAEVFEMTGDERYRAYVERFVEGFVDEDGRLFVDTGHNRPIADEPHNLDTIQPSVLLLFAHEQHPDDPRYLAAASQVKKMFDAFPTNSVGGFWHKERYPNEMWVDGLYMAEPFLARFVAASLECGDFCVETPVFQMTLFAAQVRLPNGLFLHGWDEDRNASWCVGDCEDNGLAPEVWSRGIGWLTMALVDTIRYLPRDSNGRETLSDLLRRLTAGAAANQDPATGLWCQVVDKCDDPDNWIESSGSAMLIYAIKRGVELGVLDPAYLDVAKTAWAGLISHMIAGDRENPIIADAAAGMSIQRDFASYVGISRLSNSPHGLCAVLLAAAAMEY